MKLLAIYMIAHASSPFLKAQTIDKGIEIIMQGEYDSVVVGEKIQDIEPIYIETNGRDI